MWPSCYVCITGPTSKVDRLLRSLPRASDLGCRIGFYFSGSWVVISRVLNKVTILITHIRGLITPLLPTPEPPSSL